MSWPSCWRVALSAWVLLAGPAVGAGSGSAPRWGWLADPRTAVLAALGAVALGGGLRKWMQHVRARRAIDRLAESNVTPAEIAAAADHGREALMELLRILSTDDDASHREAAGRALARLWAHDQLVAEEERAIVTRGYQVTWKARRRYPREMTRPLPIVVEFGLPFLYPGGDTVQPSQLEWSYRITGAQRARLESFSPWQPGPCRVAFEIEPADLPGRGPHRLVLQPRVRTRGLTSTWELDLPHVPFSLEFDPTLSIDALLTLPDEARRQVISEAVRLEPRSAAVENDVPENPGDDGPVFLDLNDQLTLREPPVVVVTTPLPCDLAHEAAIEFEGVLGTFPAGTVVLSGQGLGGPPDHRRFPLGPFTTTQPIPDLGPGPRRLRIVLTASPERGWADPDVRSIWPGTLTTDWHPVQVIRR